MTDKKTPIAANTDTKAKAPVKKAAPVKAAPPPAIPSVDFRPKTGTHAAAAKAGFFAGVTAVVLGVPTALMLGAKHLNPRRFWRR